MTEQGRKRGRPPKDQSEVKRHALGVRTTKQLKEKLEAAAATFGRSLAQEVEWRLEQSFSRGDKHIAIPLDLASAMMRMAEERTGQQWNEDLATWVAAKKAIEFMFVTNRPAAPNQPAIAEAEEAFKAQALRWTPASPTEQMLGLGDKLEGVPLLDMGAKQTAQAELDAAKAKLGEAAAPARAMFLEGQTIAEDIADLFRLRARQE